MRKIGLAMLVLGFVLAGCQSSGTDVKNTGATDVKNNNPDQTNTGKEDTKFNFDFNNGTEDTGVIPIPDVVNPPFDTVTPVDVAIPPVDVVNPVDGDTTDVGNTTPVTGTVTATTGGVSGQTCTEDEIGTPSSDKTESEILQSIAVKYQPDVTFNKLVLCRAGEGTTSDYFRFEIATAGHYEFKATWAKFEGACIDVDVYSAEGGWIIGTFGADATTASSLAVALGAGTYYIRVSAWDGSGEGGCAAAQEPYSKGVLYGLTAKATGATCTEDSDCETKYPSSPKCVKTGPNKGTCAACASDTHCLFGEGDDAVQLVCATKDAAANTCTQCEDDKHCGEGAPVCLTSGPSKGLCAGCAKDDQCPSIKDDQNNDVKQYCAPDNFCYECTTDEHCSDDRICLESLFGYFCAEGCRKDTDCDNGEICTDDNFCVPGCREKGDCKDSKYPECVKTVCSCTDDDTKGSVVTAVTTAPEFTRSNTTHTDLKLCPDESRRFTDFFKIKLATVGEYDITVGDYGDEECVDIAILGNVTENQVGGVGVDDASTKGTNTIKVRVQPDGTVEVFDGVNWIPVNAEKDAEGNEIDGHTKNIFYILVWSWSYDETFGCSGDGQLPQGLASTYSLKINDAGNTSPECQKECNHGKCTLEGENKVCECDPGFEGDVCNEAKTCDTACGEHGDCKWKADGENDAKYCACTDGYTGPACAVAPVAPTTANVWINEFHYENEGDDAFERIEIGAAPGTDLAGWTVVFVNGREPNAARAYSTDLTTHIKLTGKAPDGSTGYFSFDALGFQNGKKSPTASDQPDGIILLNPAGKVVQFLSYEGVINKFKDGKLIVKDAEPKIEITDAEAGVSIDVGVRESHNTQGDTGKGSLQLVCKDDKMTWIWTPTSSFGKPNNDAEDLNDGNKKYQQNCSI